MREVCGRIMLGPSLLGFVAPDLYTRFLPPSLGAFPGVYAQLGVIRYLFLVGLDLDLGVLRESGVLLVLCVVGALVQGFLQAQAGDAAPVVNGQQPKARTRVEKKS